MPTMYKSSKPGRNELPVVELFETVQGEGKFIGVPSIFFRTGMCNLACPGCDTVWDEWQNRTLDDVLAKIRSFKAKHIVFTGGEPTLWQENLAALLWLLSGYHVTIETNGAVPLRNVYFTNRVNLWSFSPKVGSLGHDEVFSREVVLENMLLTAGRSQIKYVLNPSIPEHIDSVFEFQDRVDGLKIFRDEEIFFQPYDRGTTVNVANRSVPGAPISIRDAAFNEGEEYNVDLKLLTKVVMERSGSRFRVVPQLHKYIVYR